MSNYELTLKKFNETENCLFGVFVSHSNAPADLEILEDLNNYAESKSVHLVYDRKFLEAGDDFRQKILQYANCYAAIVLLTENSIGSAWVNYEIGILNSRKIPLFIYDPNNILIKPDYQYDYQIKQFLPAFNNKEYLIKKIKELSVFSGLYPVGTKKLSIDKFNECFTSSDPLNKIEKCMITMKSTVFDENREWFERCRIGALIVRFGQLDECNSKCSTAQNTHCPACNNRCALLQITSPDQCEDGICTILNNIIYTGRIIYTNEKNIFEKNTTPAATAMLKLGIPVHSHYGVKFKMIFDAENEEVKNHVIDALEEKKMLNPSVSTTGNPNRIYCSIEENSSNGIFVIEKSFNDNFICPLVCFDN